MTARRPARALERTVQVLGVAVTVFESSDVEADLQDAIHGGQRPPYGRVLWPSALAAAEALAGWPLQGRHVLEIGAGCGLVSLWCARQGARVTATDVDAAALSFIEAAADAQGVTVTTRPFDVVGDAPLPDADVVVCADLLYEEHLARAVARRVVEARARGAEVLVADPGRVSRPVFLGALRAAGLTASMAGEPIGLCALRAEH